MFKSSPFIVAGACVLGALSSPALAVEDNFLPAPLVSRADQPAPPVPIRVAYNERAGMGGGFVEFLFGGGAAGPAPGYEPAQRYEMTPARRDQRMLYPAEREPSYMPQQAYEPARPGFDPKYEKQMVEYTGREAAGTIVIDTPSKFLYLVQALPGRA